ncbi:MAG: hypothetical protein ACLS9K_11390 [Lachnospira eligens]
MKKNKSNINKRVLAIVLCMALMLSSGISTMADNDAGTPVPETEPVRSLQQQVLRRSS